MNLFEAERLVATAIQRIEESGDTRTEPILFLAGYGKHLKLSDPQGPAPAPRQVWADPTGMKWICRQRFDVGTHKGCSFMRPASIEERPEVVTARKEHRCLHCEEPIPVGTKYVRKRITPWDHRDNEGFSNYRSHMECDALWQKVGMDSDWEFWNDSAAWKELLAKERAKLEAGAPGKEMTA